MRTSAVGVALAALVCGALAAAGPAGDKLPTVKRITTIYEDHPKSADWCAANELIAFCGWQLDGYCDVFVMRPDGKGVRCLTSRAGLCPQRHNGNPAWHPSGEFIAFTAQNEDAARGEDTVLARAESKSVPGSGVNCNLWVVKADGSKAWQLTDSKTDYDTPRGVIHPQFSSDGKKIAWAALAGEYPRGMVWGRWAIYVADFALDDGGPKLKNVQKLQPGQQMNFYETHAFSKDGSRLLFSANCEPGQPVTGIDIYEYEIASGRLKNLTNTPGAWDEHAHWSPDGKWIAWMSSTGMDINYKEVRGGEWRKYLKTDLWIMDSGGKERERLTFFNEKGHPHYLGGRTIVSDSAWSPDGKGLVVTVAHADDATGVTRRTKLVLVELDVGEH